MPCQRPQRPHRPSPVELHELAVVRTKYAQSKGFATWARYVMDQQAHAYSKEFKSFESKIDFLEDLLARTRAPWPGSILT